MTKPVLGIDFGTTNTTAAFVDAGGRLRLVAMRDRAFVLPTYVWFDGKGSVLVGGEARKQAVDDPMHTVFGFKRFLGRRHASDFVHRHSHRFGYGLVQGPDGNAAIQMHGRVHSLEEVTFHVFHRVLELASATGESFEECVLTVPAHFSYRQRRALKKAAEMAGLEVKGLVNEPTAAALYYLQQTGREDTLLVYDLGGGTFDATLLSIQKGIIEILATDGDAFLGGADFDARVVDALVERYLRETGIDLRRDGIVMQRLGIAAEQAKIQLTDHDRAPLAVRCVALAETGFLNLETILSRVELEQLTAPLIEKTLGVCEDILARADRRADQIDGLIFVGGQTRMPALRARLTRAIRFDPSKQVDPEISVCAGAAILGRGEHVLVDVMPMSIGLMLPGGMTHEVIAPSSVLPCVRRVPLSRPPARPNGPPLPIAMVVYEATSSTATERDVLGRVVVDPQWLQAHPGALSLEVRMSREFDLQLFVHGDEGARLPLRLEALS